MASETRIWPAYCIAYAAALAFVFVVLKVTADMQGVGLASVPYGQAYLLCMVGAIAIFRFAFEPITGITLTRRYWVFGMIFVGLVVFGGMQLILQGYVGPFFGQIIMLLTSFFGGRELLLREVKVPR